MCGICGELAFTDAPVRADRILRMARALAHRGPDDEGMYCSGPIGLGHRRLAIIDLSSNGHQPMWTADRSKAIVFNGEVYNHSELRKQLVAKGYRFASLTDTEVVLNAVHCWGMDAALAKFVGMFAFAIWDADDRSLWLCRDRVGVKPLYYYLSERSVLFGSELKALLAHPGFRRELSPLGLGQSLVLGYSLGESTVFRNTFKLLPGHHLRITTAGDVQDREYWSLDTIDRNSFSGTFDEASDRLGEICEDAFAARLVADVPVGLFLSGGIDSSFLAAMLRKKLDVDLIHFTIGFREKAFDETPKAAAVAAQLGLQHVVRYADPPDAQEALLRFVEVYDEPFSDSSGIPTSILSSLAREHVKVALSADGGDEQFCGYESYPAYAEGYSRVNRWPGLVRRAAASVLGVVAPHRLFLSLGVAGNGRGGRIPRAIARHQKALELLRVDRPMTLIRLMNEKVWTSSTVADALCVTVPDIFEGTVLDSTHLRVNEEEMIDAMMRTDYTAFLRDDILTKVDRASMAVSLECRDPLLDHRIAEFAFTLPIRFLYGGGEHKRIVKHLLRPWLSESILSAPKRGFSIPLRQWLSGPWKPSVMEYLSPGQVTDVGILRNQTVQTEVENFYRYPGYPAEKVMAMLNLQMWARRWYLGAPALDTLPETPQPPVRDGVDGLQV